MKHFNPKKSLCKWCIFWLPAKDYDEKVAGFCHRYPPKNPFGTTAHPMTHDSDWCGEFQEPFASLKVRPRKITRGPRRHSNLENDMADDFAITAPASSADASESESAPVSKLKDGLI